MRASIAGRLAWILLGAGLTVASFAATVRWLTFVGDRHAARWTR
jgi:hypothetical protein